MRTEPDRVDGLRRIGPARVGEATMYDFAYEDDPSRVVRLFIAGDATHWHIELIAGYPFVEAAMVSKFSAMLVEAARFAELCTCRPLGAPGRAVQL